MMLSVGVGLIAAATLGAPAATATTATAAQDTFLAVGAQAGDIDQFVTLRRDPPSGTHPHSESACRVLGEAGGDFGKSPDNPTRYARMSMTR
jgi:hypothetical protein